SLLAQTWTDWRLVLVSDDGVDYEAVLASAGLRDRRFNFIASGSIGGGASAARNRALDSIDTAHVAILDADDRFKPQKLARAVTALSHADIVTSALDVMDSGYRTLRHVGTGPDRLLSP